MKYVTPLSLCTKPKLKELVEVGVKMVNTVIGVLTIVIQFILVILKEILLVHMNMLIN